MKNNKGFTLIELLSVIAIIGVLTGITMAGVRFAREKARTTKAQHDIEAIYNAIVMLANSTRQWPGHQEPDTICTNLPGGCPANNEICGLDANSVNCTSSINDGSSGIKQNDAVTPFANWDGPYMDSIPLDPWGHEYFFDTDYLIQNASNEPCNGDALCHNVVVVGSYGPDGVGVPSGGAAGSYGADDIIKIITY